MRALIEAEASDNARDPARFETELEVQVKRDGSPVADAVVRVGSLTLRPSDPGTYAAHEPGYRRSYTLDVHAGADSLTDARLDGPLAHSFSSPTAGTRHPAGQPLEVRWAPTGADEANIETRELSSTTVPDSGSYTVAGSYLTSGHEEDTERVRLTRANQLALAGGAPGSTLIVSVRNEVEFFIRKE